MPDQGENIFNNVTPPEGDKQPTPPVDKYADLLKSIKNESGEQKYDSIEKALEALGHRQSFIPQIKSQLTEKEQELERVKAELSQRQSVEEVMQRLIAINQHGTVDPQINSGIEEQEVIKLWQQNTNKNKK